MFKTTLKSVAMALSILAAVLIILTAVDGAQDVASRSRDTFIKITVVDLDGAPVHNAQVSVGEQNFFTDNKGCSPSIEIGALSNCYDASQKEWGTVTVKVTKEGFIPAFVFNCIVYKDKTRTLAVKIYPQDGSDLPYVSYVESPPDEYVRRLLGQKS